MVRIATTLRPLDSAVAAEVCAAEMARTVSATASSSREGSKRMFGPTVVTRSVIGGLAWC